MYHHGVTILRLLLAVLLAGCLNHVAFAQSGRKVQGKEGEKGEQGEKPIVKLETREVVIPLTAYDLDGRFVDNLAPLDVLVLEEGEPRPVSSIKRESANIVLVLDLSNEIGTFKNGPTKLIEREERPIWVMAQDYQVMPRPTARELAEKFVERLSTNDYISIIQYSDRVQTIQDWTNDPSKAIDALNSKYRVGIKASYFDALKLAADKLQTRQQGRRVIVLVSDGLDSNSKTARTQALKAIERSRASVFVVGWAEALRSEIEFAANWSATHEVYNSPVAQRIAELRRHLPRLEGAALELHHLAASSGGEMWLPATHEQMVASWRPLAGEIGAQYSLAFITERKPSLEDTRSIQVIAARSGVIVRSRPRYYVGDDPRD
jgi:Ca-activated chloride channel homolog